jgi:YihY family inner membrane protein
VNILWKSIADFFRHNGLMLAGAIACFSLMALVPFFLLLVSVFGYILGEHLAFYDFLSVRLSGFFPDATSEINEELGKIIAYKRIGLFTLAVYAYFSYQLFYSLESAVNTIFGTHGKRPLLTSLMLSLLVINVLIVFIMISFGATSLISLIGPLARFFPGLSDWDMMSVPVGIILPAFLVFIIASGLYMVLPHTRVRTRHALTGALFTAVLFEAAKHVFTYYIVMKITEFGNVYGPLSAVVIFLLWIFFAACIFLLGAELVHNLGNSGVTLVEESDSSLIDH